MSNRFNSQSSNDSRSTAKPQKKHAPKSDSRNPTSRNTLSNSLREAAAGGVSMAPQTSRVRMCDDGEWVSKAPVGGNFVVYLPQDDAVAAGLGPEEGGLDPVESQHVVDLLNRELSRLLKLRPRDFWREVATDESLHAFLESFLKFRSRWYDFPHRGARGIVAGVIVGEFELCRRIFMILYRLSSNRDPGAKAADSLSSKDHEELLQDKKLLDLSKLLDICAIFAHENEDLTRVLVMNALKAQPDIQHEFPVLVSHFLSIVQTMYQRCSSSLEVLRGSGAHQDAGSNRLHSDYLEVMDFINDSVVTLDSFVNAYKYAALFFSSPIETGYGNEELLVMLARLHDSLLPSLYNGFHTLLGVSKDKKEISGDLFTNVFTSLKILSTRIAKFGWTLLYYCFLSDDAFESSTYSPPVSMKMFPATVDDPVVRADILLNTIRSLTNEQRNVLADRTWGTFIQRMEQNFEMMSRLEFLQETGWLSMDEEQFQLLSAITMTQPHAGAKKLGPATSSPATTNKTQMDEDMAITESKIIQIKELFPEYGRGFLTACLEAYNHDPEQVIQRILEGTLHEELQSLDTSLETAPPPKSTLPTNNSRDKGKGKLIEPTVAHPGIPGPTTTLGSSSSFGRFVRKNTDDPSYLETLNAKDKKEVEKTVALASQLEYEDEYDDSFDDLGLSVADAGPDEAEGKMSKMPLGGGAGPSGDNSSKWGSRKKPQYFVKDGKNYSYKVEGSVAVVDRNEARLVNQFQRELIHGLGQGGNIPMGAAKKLTNEEEEDDGHEGDDVGRRGGGGRDRGRGGRVFFRGGLRKLGESNEVEEDGEGEHNGEVGGRGGRGRRGSRGGSNYRKARAMSKQLTGLPAHYR